MSQILNEFWIEYECNGKEYTVEGIHLLDSEGDGKYAALLGHEMLRDEGIEGCINTKWIHSESYWVGA